MAFTIRKPHLPACLFTHMLAFVCAITSTNICGFETPIQQSKPYIVFRTPRPAPPTLQDLLKSSEVIAHGRVMTRTIRPVQSDPKSAPLPYTENTILVLEVFKGAETLGGRSEFTLLTARGTMQGSRGNTVELRSNATILDVGQEAVLFLARSPDLDAYYVVGNVAGVFVLREKSVSIPSAARTYREFAGEAELDKARFLSLLRTLRINGDV